MFGASKPKPDPPENDDDDDESTDVAGFLSQELLKLSLVDRTAIQEEIHGVRCLAVPETPELLQTSLHEFSKEVDRHVRNATSNGNGNGQSGSLLPASKTWAYRQLLEQYNKKNSRSGSSNMNFNSHSNFALDDAFRLRFLRCELFDVARAVVRFFHYLDYTYEYWGEVALQRPIMFQDFTKAELKVLKKGYFQLLPFRDSSGRRIMVVLGGMDPHQDIRARVSTMMRNGMDVLSPMISFAGNSESMRLQRLSNSLPHLVFLCSFVLCALDEKNKIFFYLWDVVTRDSVESQQKGFVMIRLHGNISNEDATSSESSSSESTTSANPSFRSVIDNLNRSLSSIPSRLIANHNRIPNHPGHRLVWKLFVTKVLSGENAGLRPRFIACPSGSDMETKYSLKSYGIPTQLLPLTDTDSIKCTYHTQWMKTRKLLEEQEFGVWNPPRKGASASATATATRKAAINSKYTVVECPGLNDVIFRKGSRVTSIENPGNRFFRDLLRTFLEEKERVSEQLKQEEEGFITPDEESSFLTSTSPISRASSPPLPISATTASKATPLPSAGGKKNTGKAFCDWLVEHIEEERNGRFLEWNNDIHCWVVMEDRNQTSRKVSITLYNWGKRFHTETAASKRLKQQQQQRSNPILPMRHGSQSTSDEDDNLVGVENNPFQFIDGGRHPYEPRGHCCDSFTGAYGNPTSSIGRKRPRIETTPSIKPAIFQWGSIPN